MKPIQIAPEAARDLATIAEYLEEQSDSPYLGDRFFLAAAKTFYAIGRFPEAGRARPRRREKLASVRSLSIDRPFDKYLIFYRTSADTTLVLRVLHGAQRFTTVPGIKT